jgi:hypothetical protein
MKPMTAAELDALDEVIEYLIQDEMKEFRDCEDPERKSRLVYSAIYRLARWRGHDIRDWPDPLPPRPLTPSDAEPKKTGA